MTELKTQANDASVEAFLATVDAERRADCERIASLMAEATGAPAIMWGTSIVGFGAYHYRYASGRAGQWFLTGFSPRKRNLTVYIMPGFSQYGELLETLGPHKTGKSCLYIKRLADVDMSVLASLITASVAHLRETYDAD